MMESDYDLPSLHCYTMNPASETMATTHPPTTQLQQQSVAPNAAAPPAAAAATTTTPPLKRTRAKRSCDFCRQRKSRCDADTCTPCTNCKAWGYTCEFQTVRKKRGPPSVYVDNLEKRCKKMEQLLMQLTNTTIKDLEQNDFRTTHRRAISDPSIVSDSSSDDDDDDVVDNSTSSPMSAHSTTTNDNNNIVHRLEQLDSHDYDSIKYTGQSAGLELVDQDIVFKSKPYIAWPGRRDTVLQRMADDQLMVVRTEKSPSTGKIDTRLDVGISITSALPSSSMAMSFNNNNTIIGKPPKSLVTQMVTFYFTHLHPILPIINKPRFLHLYNSHSSVLPKILLQAILALSCRRLATSDQQQYEQYADYFFRKVMKRLQQDTTQSRLCHVQAGLLATLYLDLSTSISSSMQWQVLGKAIRMAQDLGLHRSCAHWHHLPSSEIETRHRVFYACYVLDRWIGARAGKPLTILDRDFDTAMPSMYEVLDDDNSSTPGDPVYRGFYLWIKLSEILGRVLKALYAPSARRANSNANLDDPMILVVFDRRLRHWLALLDESSFLVNNNTRSHWSLPMTQKVNLQIYYNTVILLLRRPFISASNNNNNVPESLVTESRQVSLQAALTIFQLIQQQQQQQSTITATAFDNDTKMDLMGPCHLLPTCYVYAMFLSSLVHVAVVLHDRTSLKKRRALAASLALIQSHQHHLGASRQALDILNMLVTIHDIQPTTPIDDDDDNDDVMQFKPIKTESSSLAIDTSFMISNYSAQEEDDSDGILDHSYCPVSTTTTNTNRSLAFHHPPPSFDSHHHHHFTTTTTPTSFIESEMPKTHWFQRFVNTSVVGGVPSEIQHDVASDLAPTAPSSYLCPPNNNNNNSTLITTTTQQQPSPSPMFYTPYMPSPPMPTSSPAQHHHHHHHHALLSSSLSPEEASSSSIPATPRTTTMIPPPPPPMPLSLHSTTSTSNNNMNWHDWPFYMHPPPSSSLSK